MSELWGNGGIIAADQAWRESMERSSNQFTSALAGKKAPKNLQWFRQTGRPALAESATFRQQQECAGRQRVLRAEIDARRVKDREPCPNCGTNGAFSCKHRGAA